MLVGSKEQPPREVIWWLAKYVPDPERNEPRNTGLILRTAESETLVYLFHPTIFRGAVFGVAKDGHYVTSNERRLHEAQVDLWKAAMEKYGARCMVWLPKKRSSTLRHSIVRAGSVVKGGRINVEALYERLVL